jgi:predicted Fe-S protein YdhL (DUF1289 family)
MAGIMISCGGNLEEGADHETEQNGAALGPVESPCNRVCVVDAQTGYCIGCGRTLEEIAEWGDATAARRRQIVCALIKRLTQISALERDAAR